MIWSWGSFFTGVVLTIALGGGAVVFLYVLAFFRAVGH